jgi:cytidylate kinase
MRFLDTGIMYRAVTWLALNLARNVNDADAMGRLASCRELSLVVDDREPNVIAVDGHSLSASDLASEEVNRNVSAVSAGSAVRRALVAQQRTIAAEGAIVMVGRDIGSVVLPDADVKLYFNASPEERAQRRFLQQKENGADSDYQSALAETNLRDRLDSERADSPLTVPEGAVVINTDNMDFAQTVDAVVSEIHAATRADPIVDQIGR